MRPRAIVAAAVLSTIAFTGCSKQPAEYDNISALSAAVDAAGIDCDPLEPAPEAQLVEASGICVDSGVTLYLFDDPKSLENWRKVGTRLSPSLIGPDWAATGDMQVMDRLAAELGGEITTPDK